MTTRRRTTETFGAKFLSQINSWLPCCSQQMQASTFSRKGQQLEANTTVFTSLLPQVWLYRLKMEKKKKKVFCYCCCALTFPSLMNVFLESILFCPSFSFGNMCLSMCIVVIIWIYSYIYNCVQACPGKTDNRKIILKKWVIYKKEFIRINCGDLLEWKKDNNGNELGFSWYLPYTYLMDLEKNAYWRWATAWVFCFSSLKTYSK